MKCPEDRKELVVGVHDGQVGHGCDSCGGMWLPAVFVESLAYGRELRLSEFYGELLSRESDPRQIACPTACGVLSCARIHEVEVDWCPDCRGVWFNRGELDSFLQRHPVREPVKGVPGLGSMVAADLGLNVLWALIIS